MPSILGCSDDAGRDVVSRRGHDKDKLDDEDGFFQISSVDQEEGLYSLVSRASLLTIF